MGSFSDFLTKELKKDNVAPVSETKTEKATSSFSDFLKNELGGSSDTTQETPVIPSMPAPTQGRDLAQEIIIKKKRDEELRKLSENMPSVTQTIPQEQNKGITPQEKEKQDFIKQVQVANQTGGLQPYGQRNVPENFYENQRQLAEAQNQAKTGLFIPSAGDVIHQTALQKIQESWRRGDISTSLDLMAADSANLSNDPKVLKEDFKKIKKLRDKYNNLASQDPLKAQGWFKQNALEAVQMLPAIYRSLVQAGTGTLLTGNPLVGTGASVAFWTRQGQGDVYAQMMDEGVDPTVAKWASLGTGTAYAGVQQLQMKGLLPKGVADGLMKQGTKFFAKNLQKFVGQYALEYGKQVSEEGVQRAISETGMDIAKWIDPNYKGKTAPEYIDNLLKSVKEETLGAAKTMGFLLVPGAAIDIATGKTRGGVENVKESGQAVQSSEQVRKEFEQANVKSVSKEETGTGGNVQTHEEKAVAQKVEGDLQEIAKFENIKPEEVDTLRRLYAEGNITDQQIADLAKGVKQKQAEVREDLGKIIPLEEKPREEPAKPKEEPLVTKEVSLPEEVKPVAEPSIEAGTVPMVPKGTEVTEKSVEEIKPVEQPKETTVKLEQSLIDEAKKYKSAEEFIKHRIDSNGDVINIGDVVDVETMYGTKKAKVTKLNIDKRGTVETKLLSETFKVAPAFSKTGEFKKGGVLRTSPEYINQSKYDDITKVINREKENKIKLTEIWNKANKPEVVKKEEVKPKEIKKNIYSEKIDELINEQKAKGKILDQMMIDKLVERGYDRKKLESMGELELNKTWSESVRAMEKSQEIEAKPKAVVQPTKAEQEKQEIKEIYHGTDKVFENFDVSKSADGSIWFTDNKSKIEKGEVSASGKGKIMSRFIDENNLKLAGWEESDKYSTDELLNQGYDGVKLKDKEETTYQIFNPEKLLKSKEELRVSKKSVASPMLAKKPSKRVSLSSKLISNLTTSKAFFNEFDNLINIPQYTNTLRKSSNRVDGITPSSKRLFNSMLINIKTLRDIIQTKAFEDKGFSGLDTKTQRLMVSNMISLARKNSKIVDGVVEFIPVDMMNYLTSKKLSPNSILKNSPMLSLSLSKSLNNEIPSFGNMSNAFIRSFTLSSAKEVSRDIFSNLKRPPLDSDTTNGTKNINHRNNNTRYDREGQTKETEKGVAFFQKFEPTFYSTLQRTLEQKMPSNAPVDQVRNLIKPDKGVKPEEVEWSGIEEFLKDKKTVNKQELLDYLKANEIQIQEVTKLQDRIFSDGLYDKAKEVMKRNDNFGFDTTTDALNFITTVDNTYEMNDSDRAILNQFIKEKKGFETNKTKYQTYQIEGGENYKELLLTIPVKKQKLDETIKYSAIQEDNDYYQVYANGQIFGNPVIASGFQDAVEKAKKLGEVVDEKSIFKSTHFDEKNILVHVRMNDRVIDDKKTLFIEEVQSDWHQQGRKKGYRIEDSSGEIEMLKKQRKLLTDSIKNLNSKIDYDNPKSWTYTDRENIKIVNKLVSDRASLSNKIILLEDSFRGLPNAPFKKTWHELAMKRMLRYAVDNGYEQMAWTSGEQQNDRYDLSKQVDSIEVLQNLDHWVIRTYKNGNLITPIPVYSESVLEETVGKDLANKIVNEKIPIGKVKIYSGIDLKIGGEGMKGFYDKILVDYMNKFAKKFGSEVKDRLISNYPLTREQLNEKMKEYSENSLEMKELKSYEKGFVHTVEITPQMKESVLKGFPLFQKSQGKKSLQLIEAGKAMELLKPFGVNWEDIQLYAKIKYKDEYVRAVYLNGVVAMSQDVLTTTGSHEAFHYYSNVFADADTKARAYAEAKKYSGVKTDRDAEEFLAEKFAKYRLDKETKKPIFKKLFDMILSNMKKLFGIDKYTSKMFSDFEKGKSVVQEKVSEARFQEMTPAQQALYKARLRATEKQKQFEKVKRVEVKAEEVKKEAVVQARLKPTVETAKTVLKKKGYQTIKKSSINEIKKQIIDRMRLKQTSILASKKAVIEFAKKHLNAEDQGKMLARVKNLKTEKDKEKAIEYIKEIADKVYRRKLISTLRETIKSIKPDKMYPNFRDKIKELTDNLDLKGLSARKEARLIKLKDLIENKDLELPQEYLNELDRLDAKNVTDMTNDEISTLIQTLKMIDHLNKFKGKLTVERRVREFSKMKKEAIDNLEITPEKDRSDETLMNNLKDFFDENVLTRFFTVESLNAEVIAQELDHKKDGIIKKIIYDGADLSRDDELKVQQNAEDYFREAFKDINLKEWSEVFYPLLSKHKIPKQTYNLEYGQKLRLTKMQKVAFYLHMQNEDNARHIISQKDSNGKWKGGISFRKWKWKIYRISETDASNIINSMTKEERQVADVFDYYFNVMQKDQLNKVSVKINGFEIATVLNYFPISSNSIERKENVLNKQENLTSFGQFLLNTVESRGMFKDRTKARGAIYLDDAMIATNDSLKQASKYIGYAEPLRTMKALLRDGDFEATVLKRFGQKYYDSLTRFVIDIEQGNVGLQMTGMESIMKNIKNKISITGLGLRLSVLFKQPISYLLAANEIDPKYMNQPKGASLEEMSKYSPQLRQRYKGNITQELGDIADAGHIKYMFTGKSDLVSESVMGMIEKMDKLAVSRMYKAVESETKDLHPELKVGTEEFGYHVAKRTEEIVRKTQSTFDEKDRSEVARRGHIVIQFLSMFSSQTNKNFIMMKRAYIEYRDAPKTVKNLEKFIFKMLNVALLGSMLNAMTDMLFAYLLARKPEKEEWYYTLSKSTLASALSNIYVIGPQMSSALNGYEYRDNWTNVTRQFKNNIVLSTKIAQQYHDRNKKKGRFTKKEVAKFKEEYRYVPSVMQDRGYGPVKTYPKYLFSALTLANQSTDFIGVLWGKPISGAKSIYRLADVQARRVKNLYDRKKNEN